MCQYAVEDFGSLKDIGIFYFIVLVGTLVTGREKKGILSSQKFLQVIVEVGSFFLVMGHDQVETSQIFEKGDKNNHVQTTGKSLNLYRPVFFLLDMLRYGFDIGIFRIEGKKIFFFQNVSFDTLNEEGPKLENNGQPNNNWPHRIQPRRVKKVFRRSEKREIRLDSRREDDFSWRDKKQETRIKTRSAIGLEEGASKAVGHPVLCLASYVFCLETETETRG